MPIRFHDRFGNDPKVGMQVTESPEELEKEERE
jgi:hypothetical protein